MRVLSFAVPGWVNPDAAFPALYAHEEWAIWLDSGQHATEGMSVMGAAARVVSASVADDTVTIDGSSEHGTIFEFLSRDLASRAVSEMEGYPLGWVGWLGYELRAQTAPPDAGRQSRYPDAALIFLDRGIVFDHASRSVTLVALGQQWEGELRHWRDTMVTRLSSAQPRATPVPARHHRRPSETRVEPRWAYTDSEYLAMIRQCQAAITAGNAYQLCLTTEARVAVFPEPFDAYLSLRQSSPTHHGAFLRMGGISILSSSPEQFLSVSPNGRVLSKPIKGTRRRGCSIAADVGLRRELESSDKERAENVMIVDLMRNDIARIAEVGSVRVESLLTVESYAQVHQLVSTVTGKLAAGVTGMDAVMSCFPAGSMTGAPKISATTILDQLEQRPRGIYSGALGYFGLDGRIDLSMVIRSIILDADGATIGSGGGITALSVPEEELDEVYLKARALLEVLGVRN